MFNLNKEYNTSYQKKKKKKRNIIKLLLRKVAWPNYTRISQSPKATGKVSNPLYENSGNFETGLKSPPYSSLSLSIWNSKRPESECIPCNWSLIWLNPTLFTESCQSHPAPLPLNSLTPTPQPPPTPPPPPTFQLPFTYSTPPPPP